MVLSVENAGLVFVKFSFIKNEIGNVFNGIILKCLHELCIWGMGI